jgi:phosphate starvation-inducible protein PhoH
VYLSGRDVVRHALVQRIIEAYAGGETREPRAPGAE